MNSGESRTSLPDSVRLTVERYGMFSAGQTVLAAVSGGPDSVALLHGLHALREVWSLSLAAAHLDHGFRGAESAADAEYVRELCSRLAIPCYTAYENVPEQKKRLHLSSQEAARRARHAFLRNTAREIGAERIALGHTRDDRAESVLLNLFRGTGPEGLTGFPPVRLPLVRPLYHASREETVGYCTSNGLNPRADASNENLNYRRNRIRRELLPYLAEHFNPQVTDAILRLADLTTAENDLLDTLAVEALPALLIEESALRLTLDLSALNARPLALRRRILRRAISRLRGDLYGIGNTAIESALTSAENRADFAIELPCAGTHSLLLHGDSDALHVVLRNDSSEQDKDAQQPWFVPLPPQGHVEFPGGALWVRTFEEGTTARAEYLRAREAGRIEAPNSNALLLPLSEVRLPLAARSWRKGDRMRPRGLNGSKKLQDIFVDRKTPQNRRMQIPVIVEAGKSTEIRDDSEHVAEAAPGLPGVIETDLEGRILGILGVQGSESCIPLTPGTRETEKIGPCVLIMALSHTGPT